MDLMQYPRADHSITHFARPKSFELAGLSFPLVMDDGYDILLSFTEDQCSWTVEGQAEKSAEYLCFKADDSTYFVSFEASLEESHVFVLDTAQRLVTHLVCKKGLNPKNRHLTERFYTFGAIRVRGYKLPYKRHGFTSEYLGTTVQWQWSPLLYTKHAYLESDWYRITWDDDGEAAEDFDTTNEMIPSTDEPVRYIKIKENMFLISLTEVMEELLLGDRQHFRCNNLTLLQNYERMYQVGRGFGQGVIDGKAKHLNVSLCAYGSPVELPEEFLNRKNPFTV